MVISRKVAAVGRAPGAGDERGGGRPLYQRGRASIAAAVLVVAAVGSASRAALGTLAHPRRHGHDLVRRHGCGDGLRRAHLSASRRQPASARVRARARTVPMIGAARRVGRALDSGSNPARRRFSALTCASLPRAPTAPGSGSRRGRSRPTAGSDAPAL